MTLLSMVRGDRREFPITLTQEDGDPLDLTNLTIVFTVKRRRSDPDADAIIQKTEGDGITITDALAGEATITIDSSDTDAITDMGTMYWDVQVSGVNVNQTPLSGRFALVRDITRAVPAGS